MDPDEIVPRTPLRGHYTPTQHGDTTRALINCLRHLNQFGQPYESFSGCLDATRQLDEMEASFHDVVGATVAGNNRSRLPSPYGLLLPAAGEFVERGLERALIYFLTRVCFLYRRQSSGRWDTSMALLEFPDRLRQIEPCSFSPCAFRLFAW